MIQFDKSVLGDFNKAIGKEWLITNGIGAYSSTSIIGCNTRRYHGLLVAPTKSIDTKSVFLSNCNETLIVANNRFELSTNQFTDVIHPEGFQYLEYFSQDPSPRFIYRIGDTCLEKKVFLVEGENTVIIFYHLLSSPLGQTCGLVLTPFVPCRDMHNVEYENSHYNKEIKIHDRMVSFKPYENMPSIFMKHNADEVETNGKWMRNFKYLMDEDSSFERHEDIFSPAKFTYILREGEGCYFGCSLNDNMLVDIYGLLDTQERLKQSKYDEIKCNKPAIKNAQVQADSFLIQKESKICGVIAGYHWLEQNTRETLIGFPGLFLIPGKYEEARQILINLLKRCDMGLIPSHMGDDKDHLYEYNDIDISLWLFYAVGKYIQYTGDYTFVKENLLQTLLDIVDYYVKGTRFGVSMDQDGLIVCYERGIPCTWIEQYGKLGQCCRWGKLIDVNALWYNALKIMEDIIGRFDKKLEIDYNNLSSEVKNNFHKTFWDSENQWLYDEIHDGEKKQGLFVNQIFALSLQYPLLTKKDAKSTLENIKKHLYTPYGLKPYLDAEKCFPWLLGHFLTAYFREYSKDITPEESPIYQKFYINMKNHMNDAGLGSISEYFQISNKNTYIPKGCISYSLSVAEFIRIWHEHVKNAKLTINN